MLYNVCIFFKIRLVGAQMKLLEELSKLGKSIIQGKISINGMPKMIANEKSIKNNSYER